VPWDNRPQVFPLVCRVLAGLTSGCPGHEATLLEADVVKALASNPAMWDVTTRWASDESYCSPLGADGLLLLGCIAKGGEAARACILASPVLVLALRVLRANAAQHAAVFAGLELINTLATSEAGRQRLGDLGACEVVVAVANQEKLWPFTLPVEVAQSLAALPENRQCLVDEGAEAWLQIVSACFRIPAAGIMADRLLKDLREGAMKSNPP
jgi:hypothetical protein